MRKKKVIEELHALRYKVNELYRDIGRVKNHLRESGVITTEIGHGLYSELTTKPAKPTLKDVRSQLDALAGELGYEFVAIDAKPAHQVLRKKHAQKKSTK